jgi:hypothetical protein
MIGLRIDCLDQSGIEPQLVFPVADTHDPVHLRPAQHQAGLIAPSQLPGGHRDPEQPQDSSIADQPTHR